jgi:ATP-dependent DNA helicase RecG
MTQKEISEMFRHSANAHFERLTSNRAEPADISLEKVNVFLKTAGINLDANKRNLLEILSNLKLTENGKYTNAALLMFAKDVGKFFLHSQLAMALFKDHNKVEFIDRKQVRTDLLTQYDEAMMFLEKHLNRRAKIVGTERIDTYEVPIEAVRETVANAIIHRDYSVQGTDLTIELYPDTLEISNPGGLVKGLTIKELGKKSWRRNELISDLFHRMHKIERMGTGIKRIKDSVKAAGLKAPRFESDYFFTTTFYLPLGPETTGKHPGNIQKTSRKHPGNIQKVLEAISTNPHVTMRELMAGLKLSEGSIRHSIVTLKSRGVLRRVGSDKSGHWEIIKK